MPLLKTLIFTIVVPGTVTVLVPRWLLSSESVRVFAQADAIQYVGVIPILLGASIYLRCAWDFASAGRGTPAPIDPPKELVVRGLYRYVRNPMYVGVLTVLFGEALLFASSILLRYATAAFLSFHLFILLYEEPMLRRKFGGSYKRYCEAVPRWIPRRKASR